MAREAAFKPPLLSRPKLLAAIHPAVLAPAVPAGFATFEADQRGRESRRSRRCCVKKARERHAVREMEDVDPSEPSCRRGLQTAMSCFGTMAGVVNVMVKRRGLTASCMNEGDERKRIPVEASKRLRWHQNRSFTTAPG